MLKATAQRSRQLGPGDKLGRYEVIRQIAIGGMAELYLARTLGIEGFEKLVVLKRILPQYGTNASFVNMFLNEARLAATLHHANIAQVYDIGLEEGDYFFAMEYVHGEDLDHISAASEEQGVPISMDAALTLVAGLCAGLHYAHEKANAEGKPLGIVHRDVSPSNVLVSYDGAVKLVDFGIARASSRPGTTQGGLKGKIAYMSPEQCRAKANIDRRSDVYSIGTILFELTTGRLPFTGETEYQILNQIVNEDAPAPSTVVPGYPPALEQIVLKALARDPDRRYATALELQTQVEDFAHETRLRVSALVLARLMGTLFPARLEEWDHAKAQGAFFLEQHVVQTLIESGKTSDDADDPAQARDDAAAVAAPHALKTFDEEPTALADPFAAAGDTTVGDSPLDADVPSASAFGAEPDPLPAGPAPVQVPAPPEPRMPQPYPSVSSLMTATPGSLVSPTGLYGAVPQRSGAADVTERVRIPRRRHSSPTMMLRTSSSRKTIFGVLGLIAGGGAIAAAIALVTGKDSPPVAHDPAESETKKMTTTAAEPPPPPSPPPVDPPPEQANVATDESPDDTSAAKVPPTSALPKATKPAPKSPPAKVTKVEKPRPVTKPKPAPKPKSVSKPKEQTWNADSPFMPVRTDKR